MIVYYFYIFGDTPKWNPPPPPPRYASVCVCMCSALTELECENVSHMFALKHQGAKIRSVEHITRRAQYMQKARFIIYCENGEWGRGRGRGCCSLPEVGKNIRQVIACIYVCVCHHHTDPFDVRYICRSVTYLEISVHRLTLSDGFYQRRWWGFRVV